MTPNTEWPGLPDYTGPTEGYFTLLHHADDAVEYSRDVMERIEYIKTQKPENERATRLRHIRHVGKEAPKWWAEYERVTAPAWAEYQRVTAPALAEYQRVTAPAWAEYQRVEAAASAECERVTAPAWAEYQRVEAAASAECERVKAAAWAEYQRVKAAARQRVTDKLHELIPDCRWDGTRIVFEEVA